MNLDELPKNTLFFLKDQDGKNNLIARINSKKFKLGNTVSRNTLAPNSNTNFDFNQKNILLDNMNLVIF